MQDKHLSANYLLSSQCLSIFPEVRTSIPFCPYLDSRGSLAKSTRVYNLVLEGAGTTAWSPLIHTVVFNSDLLSASALIYLFGVFFHFVLHKPFVGFLEVIATELDFNGVNISVCYLVV